jgi:hypothetical protein
LAFLYPDHHVSELGLYWSAGTVSSQGADCGTNLTLWSYGDSNPDLLHATGHLDVYGGWLGIATSTPSSDALGRRCPLWSGSWSTSVQGARLPPGMFSGNDLQRRPYFRSAVVGLVVVAATVAADLAAFVGRLGFARIMMFTFAGLLAAAVVLLTSADLKKIAQTSRSGGSKLQTVTMRS